MRFFKSLVVGIVAAVLGGVLTVIVRATIAIHQLHQFYSPDTVSFSPGFFLGAKLYIAMVVSFLIGFIFVFRRSR